MILFTCKKYDFLIEKNLPSLYAPTTQKLGETQAQRFLRVALKKLNAEFPKLKSRSRRVAR